MVKFTRENKRGSLALCDRDCLKLRKATEAVLNHVSGAKGGIAGVYQRHDWKAEKREALEKWAKELERIVAGKKSRSNVVPLHAA